MSTTVNKASLADDQVSTHLLHDLHADLGEGPTWDERIQRLYFVDIDKQKIYSTSEDGSDIFEIDTHETVGTIALTTDPNIILAAMNRCVNSLSCEHGTCPISQMLCLINTCKE